MSIDLGEVLAKHRIILCGGTGGVGKTTTAAALGIVSARMGRRTLVLTIDPARRLAGAMGLERIDAQPQATQAVPGLSAMMLDPGSSLDEIIQRHVSSEESATRFLANPYYQQISRTVAGSREFVAMEKIHDLADSEEFETLIVDTPPSQHALDFIDAPARMIDMLDGTGLGFLLRANNMANRLSFGLSGKGQKQFARLFEQLTGHSVAIELNDFFSGFGEIISGFKVRAKKMQTLLRGSDATFLMVMTPEAGISEMVSGYLDRLEIEQINVSGTIFNQVFVVDAVDKNEVAASSRRAKVSDALLQRVLVCHHEWLDRYRQEKEMIDEWQRHTDLPATVVPRLAENVSSLGDLEQIADALGT